MTNIEYTHSFKTGRIYDFEQVIEYVKAESSDPLTTIYRCRDKSRLMFFYVELFIIDKDDTKRIENAILRAYDTGNYKNE